MTCPDESSRIDTDISEFADILMPQDGSAQPVVVGGHAVNLWCAYFMASGVAELAAFVPFTSKDLDLVGTADLLDRLYKSHKGKLTRSEPRSPVVGRLDVPRKGGGTLRIEVLHTVRGLDGKDLARTMELRIEGVAAQVLLPHLILKAKIENSVNIAQEGRNDVKHVKMMILCMRAFIIELIGFLDSGKISERTLVNILEETLVIVTGTNANKASNLWGFDFPVIWPMDELRNARDGKIARWLEHRFP